VLFVFKLRVFACVLLSAMFQQYEEEFLDLKNQIETKIKGLNHIEDPKKRRLEISQIENDINEATDTLRSMDISLRNNPSGASLKNKVKNYETDIQTMKSSLRKAESAVERDELFSGTLKEGYLQGSADSRRQLSDTTQRLERTGRVLDSAIREAEETVLIGTEAAENLSNQKSVLRRALDNIRGVNADLGSANKIMRSLARKAVANKFIVAVIVLILILAIVAVIYLKWFSSRSPPSDPDGGAGTTSTTGSFNTTSSM